MKRIEEKWNEEFNLDWIKHQQMVERLKGQSLDLAPIEALCRIYYFQACRIRQEDTKVFLTRIKELEEGIGEVLDGTLPYLAEQKLKKLIEKD